MLVFAGVAGGTAEACSSCRLRARAVGQRRGITRARLALNRVRSSFRRSPLRRRCWSSGFAAGGRTRSACAKTPSSVSDGVHLQIAVPVL